MTLLAYVGAGLVLAAVLGFGALVAYFYEPDPWDRRW